MSKPIIYLAIATAVVCLGLPAVVITAIVSGSGPGCATPSTDEAGQVSRQWDSEQTAIAQTVVDVGVSKSVPYQGLVIALATAMQESGMRYLPHLGDKNDHDSIEVFQQRPSQGWGTTQQLAQPAYQAERFLEKPLKVPQWQQLTLTRAAQAVQKSAYPNAYAKWTNEAQRLTAHVASQGSWAILSDLEQCVSNAGWTHPLPGYKVTSGFRTADRPSHDGVDIPAPRGTPIHAASTGVVIKVACNASLNGQPYSCDVDGSPAVAGCGHYSEIRTGEIIHRYCHQLRQPDLAVGQSVQVGQIIGIVGTSGHSSGPHLHFEVHRGSNASSSTALSPSDFMREMGVAGF